MIGINSIKAISKKYGIPYRDLLALSPSNDPFYVGTDGDLEKAHWFADLWHSANFGDRVHLRRVHYWLVSQKEPVKLPKTITWNKGRQSTDIYINHNACWRYLCFASKLARYLDLVEVSDIQDKKHPSPQIHTHEDSPSYYIDIPHLDNWYASVSGFDGSQAQPYHLEVWCEKSTMDDVLKPVCLSRNANLVTFVGEVSITACYELVRRAENAEKPTRIFYISDFDPAGKSMPVAASRKIEFLAKRINPDLDIMLTPLVLTQEQVVEYQLPRMPIKDSEKRAGNFEDAFGAGAVELDALEALYPGELAIIVGDALDEYYDSEVFAEQKKKEQELKKLLREKVDAVTDNYSNQLQALRSMVAELQAIQIDLEPYETQRPDPLVPKFDSWLFDNGRSYIDQISHYRIHKGQQPL